MYVKILIDTIYNAIIIGRGGIIVAVNRQKLIIRFIMFVVRNVIILSLIAGVFLMAFFIAMDIANINVLVRDGMKMRTESVFTQNTDTIDEQMGKFFTREYIINGELKLRERYKDYAIDKNKYLSKVKVNNLWCWPWQTTATAQVTETVINIQGSLLDNRVSTSPTDNTPPAWDNGKYKVYLKKVNNAWKIERIEFLSAVEVSARTQPPTTNIITPTPKPTSTNVFPTVAPNGQAGQISSSGAPVNLRSEPNTVSTIITKLNDGLEITILEEQTDWYKVKAGNSTGYVSKQYVIIK